MRLPSPLSFPRPTVFLGGLAVVVAALVAPAPAQAISRDEVMERAWAWVEDAPIYSQTPWYTDPTSGTCCYRSDCSGFVSAVWDLPPPGHTTYSFAGSLSGARPTMGAATRAGTPRTGTSRTTRM